VLGDAMDGDATLFAQEDYVEEVWRIIDPVLKDTTPGELNRDGPSVWDVIRPGSEWLTDPAKFDREVRNCLREFAEKRKPR